MSSEQIDRIRECLQHAMLHIADVERERRRMKFSMQQAMGCLHDVQGILAEMEFPIVFPDSPTLAPPSKRQKGGDDSGSQHRPVVVIGDDDEEPAAAAATTGDDILDDETLASDVPHHPEPEEEVDPLEELQKMVKEKEAEDAASKEK